MPKYQEQNNNPAVQVVQAVKGQGTIKKNFIPPQTDNLGKWKHLLKDTDYQTESRGKN